MTPRELRLWVYAGDTIAMGPARQICWKRLPPRVPSLPLVVSWHFLHKRCWDLVETMNTSFREPLVATAAGGSRGGGTVLTDCGRGAAQFRHMEEQAHGGGG